VEHIFLKKTSIFFLLLQSKYQPNTLGHWSLLIKVRIHWDRHCWWLSQRS